MPFQIRAGKQPDGDRGAEADQQDRILVDPEDRRADQQVAHRAAADAGDHREEAEGDQGLPALGREQGAGQREDGDAGEVEPFQHRAERRRKRGDGHEIALAQAGAGPTVQSLGQAAAASRSATSPAQIRPTWVAAIGRE